MKGAKKQESAGGIAANVTWTRFDDFCVAHATILLKETPALPDSACRVRVVCWSWGESKSAHHQVLN